MKQKVFECEECGVLCTGDRNHILCDSCSKERKSKGKNKNRRMSDERLEWRTAHLLHLVILHLIISLFIYT